MSNASPSSARGPWIVAVLMTVVALAALITLLAQRSNEGVDPALKRERERVLAEQVQPVEAALSAAAASSEPYDIEATMRVLRGLDVAVRDVGSVREYFEKLKHEDFRRVAPRVLESRKRILDVLVKYYSAAEQQRHEEELWLVFERWSDEFSKLLETTQIQAATPLGSISLSPVDAARQRVLADERKARAERRQASYSELLRFEEELLFALDAAVPVFREVEDEWARLCLQRDRAYLEAFAGRWDDAQVSAQAALAMAPFDVEAQLLSSLARIEGEAPSDSANPERASSVLAELDRFLHEHPDSAPALLMRGVWKARHGRSADGRTDLELAMTRYPEQAESLRDLLDPYRNRRYLGKTRQGGQITGLYESMMLGACWFSPELQSARLDMQLGDEQRAFERIRDHFARRRAQGQWDLILMDIGFCDGLLGEPYRSYFPEQSYLDLHVERTTFGKDLSVIVDNRSDRALHNATLVLCVRFTDMHPDDHVTFVVGVTQPVLPALARTAFGGLDVAYAGFGAAKGADDIVPPMRAVLVADEAVCWIDSIDYKNEQLDARHTVLGGTPGLAGTSALAQRVRDVLEHLGADDVALQRVKNLITPDVLKVELPRELMLLAPLFKLEAGDQVFDEARGGEVEHRLEGGKLKLAFEGVGKALDGAPPQVRIVARSALGDVAIVLTRNEAGNYVFARVETP